MNQTTERKKRKEIDVWVNRPENVDACAAVAVAVAIAVFIAVGATGPAEYWTWTLSAADGGPSEAVREEGAALLLLDLVLIACYLGAAWLVRTASWFRTKRIEAIDPARFGALARRTRRGIAAGIAYVAALVALDMAENLVVWARLEGWSASWGGTLLQALSWSKFLALGTAVLALGLTAVTSSIRSFELRAPNPARRTERRRKEDAIPVAGQPWQSGRARRPDSWAPMAGRAGVCLSGGGIRSASFSLGALQAIAASSLSKIAYITSVSGGGYMAAAWASLTRPDSARQMRPDTPAAAPEARPAPAFLPRSPEERWVRHHTDYLIASFLRMSGMVATVLLGLAFNLAIVLLCMQVVGQPVGWIVGNAHPELGAKEPVVAIVDQPELSIGTVTEVDASVIAKEAPCDGCVPPRESGTAFRVPIVVTDQLEIDRSASVDGHLEDRTVDVEVSSALVAEGEAGLIVLRQPYLQLVVDTASCDGADGADAEGPPPTDGTEDLGPPIKCELDVVQQPTVEVGAEPSQSGGTASGAVLSAADVRELVSIGQEPVLRQQTGTVGRDAPAFPAWMFAVLALGAVGLLVAWVTDAIRRSGNPSRHNASQSMMGLWLVAALLLFAFPYLAYHLPEWVSDLPGYKPVNVGWAAFAGFLLALLPVLRRAGGWLAKRFHALRGFRGRGYVLDIALGLVVYAIGLGIFVSIVNLAAANGMSGRLPSVLDDWLPDWTSLGRWGAFVAVLVVVLLLPVSSHAWSLYSGYRSALRSSYFLTAVQEPDGLPPGYRIESMDHQASKTWEWDKGQYLAGLSDDAVPPGSAPGPHEDWVVCTTANIRGAGEAAPGRSSGSFTFSREYVGGPEVGWMETEEYLKRIHERRHGDVTVQSSVVMSGAAFSPAMGKKSRTWQGRLLALANLRLGVWVPNPMVVARRPNGGVGGWRQPTVAWYLRELFGWYDRTAPYIYLSDGGHWENLGLVELLRRGCTDIWMVSAAGDGADSFETTAQAFALAREEVGVEFGGVELEPLRPPSEAAAGPRRLVRRGEEQPTAPKAFVKGTFTYHLADGTTVPGTIHIIEATLLGDLPWDVHAYAEANADFPDISTGYQLMDHRDFEAYRMLGFEQTRLALEDVDLFRPPSARVGSPRPLTPLPITWWGRLARP